MDRRFNSSSSSVRAVGAAAALLMAFCLVTGIVAPAGHYDREERGLDAAQTAADAPQHHANTALWAATNQHS